MGSHIMVLYAFSPGIDQNSGYPWWLHVARGDQPAWLQELVPKVAETEVAECVKVHGSPGTGLARGKLESHSGHLVHQYKELLTRSVCVQFTFVSFLFHFLAIATWMWCVVNPVFYYCEYVSPPPANDVLWAVKTYLCHEQSATLLLWKCPTSPHVRNVIAI